ncbi:hypothetical protein LZ480_16295 [Solibacillus sp. MA9]|uniref:Uncharacterized protein n=1 Tax=Solibacillus palustris TaxID=2908203 RepID=A0ABS9UGH4_9BACL|nr:hypothetical protein [Solibacillus sp. MA9]MCH7323436.1 hypothetical protein [Solibacillus sp. MA9]
MNYKKILAATAVTSAAFVVPVMVGAEDILPIEKDDLIAAGTYSVGDTVKAALTEIKTPATAEDGTPTETVDKIVSYEWFIGDATIASSQAAEFKLPMHAEGKKVKLVVTTEGQKKYFKEISVEALGTLTADVGYEEGINSPRVNSTITMKSLNIPDENEVISGYEWYLVDGSQYKLLVGENAIDLEIPIEFSGKEVLFVVKTESGKAYKKTVKIDELKFGLNPVTYSVKVNGKQTELPLTTELLPGDKIQIDHSEIIGDGGEILSAEDYEVQYKWVAFNGNDNQFTLPNATGKTFTIPVDSEKQGYKRFEVTVTISVPNIATVDSTTIGIGTSNEPIKDLIDNINKLIEFKKYTDLQAKVNGLLDSYNQLNDSAKAAITNYSKLEEYAQAFKVVEPLTKDFSKLNSDYTNLVTGIDTTIKQAELLKSVNSLRQSFNKLTAKQKEIYHLFEVDNAAPSIAQLHEWIVKIGDNDIDYVTNKAVKAFNDKVTAEIFDGEYKIVFDNDSNDFVELKAFEEKIKQYLDEAKTFDNAYQALLKTDMLKIAQADVKKAREVIEKINKISTLTDKKKASAIIAAEKAYNKLNLAQASLISVDTMEKLLNPFTYDEEQNQEDAKEAVQNLIDRINDILPVAGTGKEYPLDIEMLESELDGIAIDYKLLTSEQKKLLTNYKSVSQVKKDVSAAKRVAMSVVKAEEAEAEATNYEGDENRSKYISKMKSAHSKYNSAYKAYTKLTIEQKSLVDGDALKSAIASITAIIDDEEFAGKGEYDSSKSSEVVSQIEKIAELLKTAESTALANSGGMNTDADLQLAINTAKSMYKSLNSFEKKLVHNYALISTASSHLSKADSVKKRLLAVSDEKKFASAKQSFDKLQPVQKGLIFGTYTEVSDKYSSSGSSTLQELNDLLTDFFEVGNYNIVEFKELQKQLQYLSTTQLKTLTYYKQYQAMEKDVKTVDSFVAKMVKLGENPTYSQKDSIYKSYLKLTQVQQQLLSTYPNTDGKGMYSEILFSWMDGATGAASDLNTRIGAIIVSGIYNVVLAGDSPLAKIANFEQQLNQFTKEYKALDSKERKLVVNYSYIMSAEKDLKAVRTVIQLEKELENAEDQSKLKQAIDKLTVEQKSLYDLVKQP